MEYLIHGINHGVRLLLSFDREIAEIVFLSLAVSGAATVAAVVIAAPVGLFLSLREFKLKRVVIGALNTLMAIPSVLIGLLVYLFISRKGPLGSFGFLFTPYAIIIAQTVLAAPIVTALLASGLKNIAANARDASYSLGANRFQMILAVIKEGRFAFLTAVITGFSRVVGETGMTLMVGGNIKGLTRVMTTAISLETMKGNFELGIALGIVLLFVALTVNFFLQIIQGK